MIVRRDAEWYCPYCGFREPLGRNYYTSCPRCGKPLTIRYNGEKQAALLGLAQDRKNYAYLRETAPVKGIGLGEGRTPLLPARARMGVNVFFKLEGLNPSGSFKDRSSALVVPYVKMLGKKGVIEDTSGNTGISLSLYSKPYKLRTIIVVPSTTPRWKRRIVSRLASKVIVVPSRSQAASIAAEKARQEGLVHVNHLLSPFYIEGAKTIAYEAVLVDGASRVDVVIVPVGSGGLLLGIYNALKELYMFKFIEEMPRLIAVEGCSVAPVYRALYGEEPHCSSSSLADGLMVENPPRIAEIVKAISDTKGCVTTVNDNEIRRGTKSLIMRGILVEPTSATVAAALNKQLGECIERGDSVLAVLTGTGLKNL